MTLRIKADANDTFIYMSVLITGTSRGLGLAFAKTFFEKTNLPVIATARNVQDAKDKLPSSDRISFLSLDVTNEESVKNAAAELKQHNSKQKLRVILNVAGMLKAEKSLAQIDYHAALETFKVNTLGPLLVLKHFSPFLPRQNDEINDDFNPFGIVANISARTGSIGDNKLGGWYSYRSSKAALNQITKTLSSELVNRHINAISVSLHPGTVATDLSADFQKNVKPEKLFSPSQSAGYLLNVMRGLNRKDNGMFYDWQGKPIDW